ncbi:MAG: hypothetical protein IKM20_04545 [Erysipelotrichales bacterium]|nr:hypothetical protein [Erysipelotrichales bacterium]
MNEYTTYDEHTNTIVFTNTKASTYNVFVSGEHYAKTYGEWKPFLFCKKVKARNKYQAIIYLEYLLKLRGIQFHNVVYYCDGVKKRSK